MYELQSLSGFVNNPLGKGTSILPNRDLIVDDFKRRKKIMEGKGKDFKVTVYEEKGSYYFHVLVPSETIRDNNYDVIIQLSPPDKKGVHKIPIGNYEARFFSNSPSFVFTYAHIMFNNGMGVDCLAKKYSKDVIRKPPEVRNPTGTILYEKSIMFAALTILEKSDYFSESYLSGIVKKGAEKNLQKIVRTDEDILREIEKENKRLSLEKREEKKQEKDQIKQRSKQVKRLAGIVHSNRRVSSSNTTSSSSKSVNRIGKNVARKTTRKK